MKKLFLFAVVVGMFSCNNVNDAIEPIGPFIYAIHNVDYDGKEGAPEFVYVREGWKNFSDVKSEILQSEPLEENNTVLFKVGCMTFQTFICYDGIAGETTMSANGGRFGLKIICNDCPDQDPQFSIKTNDVDKVADGTISSPLNGFELNKLIKVSEIMKYAEPQTGIVWGDGMFVSNNPSTAKWDLQIGGQEIGNVKYTTQIKFDNGSLIDQTEVCSLFALPVDWVKTPTGKREGYFNLISWTVNENNVDYFLIKRSKDGRDNLKDWKVVGKVYSKIKNGDKGVAVEYQFLDSTPI